MNPKTGGVYILISDQEKIGPKLVRKDCKVTLY
jgi:hypothetical protein